MVTLAQRSSPAVCARPGGGKAPDQVGPGERRCGRHQCSLRGRYLEPRSLVGGGVGGVERARGFGIGIGVGGGRGGGGGDGTLPPAKQ